MNTTKTAADFADDPRVIAQRYSAALLLRTASPTWAMEFPSLSGRELADLLARLHNAELRWEPGPANGGGGTEGKDDDGHPLWLDGDTLVICVETNTGREFAVVHIDCDEHYFNVRDASTGDAYDAWEPKDWAWFAKLPAPPATTQPTLSGGGDRPATTTGEAGNGLIDNVASAPDPVPAGSQPGPLTNFSRSASEAIPGDNRRMAATAEEGTAPKGVSVNAGEPCPIAPTEVTARKDGTTPTDPQPASVTPTEADKACFEKMRMAAEMFIAKHVAAACAAKDVEIARLKADQIKIVQSASKHADTLNTRIAALERELGQARLIMDAAYLYLNGLLTATEERRLGRDLATNYNKARFDAARKERAP